MKFLKRRRDHKWSRTDWSGRRRPGGENSPEGENGTEPKGKTRSTSKDLRLEKEGMGTN